MTPKHGLAIALIATASAFGGATSTLGQDLEIPPSIAAGHDELYARMEEATEAEGELGEAARAAMAVLGPHFQKEEQYALPQLGLFPELTGAPLAPDATVLTAEQRDELIARTERLRAELPQMIEEHRRIAAALEDMREAAEAAGQSGYARLAEEIGGHARMEEEVLYPTALLIGDYARLLHQTAE